MARMRVILDGRAESNGTPLLMHNERLADPLNEFALEIGKISKKRGKTETDHLEIARLEFVGGMYFDDADGPVMPVWNVVRMIQNAGKRHKLGASVLRGVIPATQTTPVIYDGPRDIEGQTGILQEQQGPRRMLLFVREVPVIIYEPEAIEVTFHFS